MRKIKETYHETVLGFRCGHKVPFRNRSRSVELRHQSRQLNRIAEWWRDHVRINLRRGSKSLINEERDGKRMKQPTNQSTNQSTNQTTNQSTTNRSNNQPTG